MEKDEEKRKKEIADTLKMVVDALMTDTPEEKKKWEKIERCAIYLLTVCLNDGMFNKYLQPEQIAANILSRCVQVQEEYPPQYLDSFTKLVTDIYKELLKLI